MSGCGSDVVENKDNRRQDSGSDIGSNRRKGLFVKELDRALLDRKSDLSVHSLKDLPMEVPEELPVLAFSRREDPRDVLVLPEGVSELDLSKPIGSSSLRAGFCS